MRMRIIPILWILAIESASWAQSPKGSGAPDISPAEKSESKEPKRQSYRPTNNDPLPVAVIQSATDASHAVERERNGDKFNKDYLDSQFLLAVASKKQANAAIASAVIALGGTIVAGFGLCFLMKTYRETKITARASIRSAYAAKKAAKAAESAARETMLQAEDLRQAKILEHRPRLHIRNVVLRQPLFQRGMPIHGQFYVSNVGGVRAHVVESHCEILWNVNGLPMERPYEGKDGNNAIPGNPTIAPGSSTVGVFISEAPFLLDAIPGSSQPGIPKLYILGWVDYMDDLAIRRRVAFCREFMQREGSARFYPVNDPDYEYEE
jgi:hypothetical protein